ncbi:ROK family transcriptional regulator [Saccharothrix lopnurensis]|uniref:ROK family protein n=1 Tax=Saccharothrix lopnurensis TaxID=1670621 RepID=A0ABW1NX76_9PSEU
MTARSGFTTSPGEILVLIRSGRVRTRRELRDLTGLSRSTVALRVDRLVSAGYLRVVEQRRGGAGRPTEVLSFDETDKLVLAADLGATHARFALTDAGGRALAERAEDLDAAQDPDVVLKTVVRRFRDLLREAGRDRSEVVGVGVGLPAPVDFRTGRPVRPPILPGWHDVPVARTLADALGCPAFVDNDANLLGLGEVRERYPDVDGLLFVKVGTGIGAGVVLGGRPERGATGQGGDIGHVRLARPVDDARCRCGATGCLAAHASGAALARRLTERGIPAASSRDVVRLVGEGDPDAISLVRDAGRLLGEVLATAVALLNPTVVVIGGDLALTREHLLVGVREGLHERTVPALASSLAVVESRLGDRAGVHGARHLVVDQVFSAEAVDARLAPDP